MEAYEAYFSHIMDEGARIRVKFTDLTLPGCGCHACKTRREDIGETGLYHRINPNMRQGLLKVAKCDLFRNPTVPCFIQYDETPDEPVLTAGEGEYGHYDIAPNALDGLGRPQNDPEEVEADYYITSDGQNRQGARYGVFYAHWQSLNPYNVGWEAFTEVVQRVQRHLGDQIAWVRPSDLAERVHAGRIDA